MEKVIIHIMNKKWFGTDTFELEKKLFKEIYLSDNIYNILFYKGNEIEDEDFIKELSSFGVSIKNYFNREDIISKVEEINKKENILYIHTTIETTMNITNDLKKIIGQTSSGNHKIFRDKFIQRELIREYNPDLGIKFLSAPIIDLSYSKIKSQVGTPFILKPTNGVQSSGVAKIHNRNEFNDYKESFKNLSKKTLEKGIESDILIAEEFIDGVLYSIDYFVSADGIIRISEPIKERLGTDIGVDDYFVLSRITTKDTQDTFRYINLEKFVHDSVEAMQIKNSFVHHEFKINSKGELKTIEVNGRIGGGRHELMYRAFGINFFRFIIDEKQVFPKIQQNVIGINILATRPGILRGFNENLLNQIKKLESVYEIIKSESEINNEVGLTKDGFSRLGTIKLANEDLTILKRDYDFIEKKYKKLLFIERKYIEITKIIKFFRINFD